MTEKKKYNIELTREQIDNLFNCIQEHVGVVGAAYWRKFDLMRIYEHIQEQAMEQGIQKEYDATN